MNKVFKFCFISACGLALLQAVPNFKGEKNFSDASVGADTRRITIFSGYAIDCGNISLNQKKTDSLQKNKVYKYTFTAPATGTYIAFSESTDVTGVCADIGTTSNPHRIFDGGENTGNQNAKVRFNASAGQQVKIYIKMKATIYNQQFTLASLSVRKQQMALIANQDYHPNGWYTTSQYLNCVSDFGQKYEVLPTTTLSYWEADEQGMYRKEAMGFYGSANWVNGYVEAYFYTGVSLKCPLDIDFSGNLVGTAYNGYSTGNLASWSVANGAKCAVGFDAPQGNNSFLWDDRVQWFQNAFWYYMRNAGTTVSQAISLAYNESPQTYAPIYPLIRVYGNSSISLFQNSHSNNEFSIAERNFEITDPKPWEIK